MSGGVRVRFAPSPTGLLHLGGARTALFNFLYARANQGSLILRVEDTDKERYVPGSVERLGETLNWLGIHFDEGPWTGGRCAPYFQSQRLHLYQSYAQELLKSGSAYPCFCSKERLEGLRSSGTKMGYDGHCRRLGAQQVERYMDMGLPYTVRLKVPDEGDACVSDLVYGNMKVKHMTIDDQVLLKTDGYPTYHLAHVVDDHLMEISHVMRGEEWLLSTAKHLLIYSALNWQPPQFVHLPLLLSSSGGKLSKRNNDTFVETYKDKGYLPEAVINFIALLGWSPPSLLSSSTNHLTTETQDDERASTTNQFNPQELFSLSELVEQFGLEGLNKRPITVSKKLLWMNKQHFKRKLKNDEELQKLVLRLQEELRQDSSINRRYSPDDYRMSINYLTQVLQLLEDRVSLVPQIRQEAAYFWMDPTVSADTLNQIKIDDKAKCLSVASHALSACDFTSREGLDTTMRELATELVVSYRNFMLLCRLAITGVQTSPGLSGVMELLGRETVIERLKIASKQCR